MEMVAHEHPSMHPPASTPASLFQPLEKNQVVIVSFKHHFPAIATSHQLINRSRNLESQRPYHGCSSVFSAPFMTHWRRSLDQGGKEAKK